MSGSSYSKPDAREERSRSAEKRKPLRQVITEIDWDILRLLARRYNLLEKMRHKGRLDSAEEKFIREAWQNSVAKVSRDPQLSGRFFSLMQELTFLPKPETARDNENLPGDQRRQAFNLAPSKSPVNVDLRMPLDSRATRAWVYLSAAAGAACRLQPTLQNDMEVDFEKALQRMDAHLSFANDLVEVSAGEPLGWPDASLFIGDSDFNFYLLLAHYIGHTSKVRFDGAQAMKLADFSRLRAALPGLGARMTHIIPKNFGLPCRVECSGLLPPLYKADSKIPAQFCEALILAASFYEAPFAVDLSDHPASGDILARVMPILEASGANFVMDGKTVNLQPAALSIPETPAPPMDEFLAPYLLALAVPNGGTVRLSGKMSDNPALRSPLQTLARNGMDTIQTKDWIKLELSGPPEEFTITEDDLAPLARRQFPLFAAIGASVALAGGNAAFPPRIERHGDTMDFFHACGLEINDNGVLGYFPQKGLPPVWNAPDPW